MAVVMRMGSTVGTIAVKKRVEFLQVWANPLLDINTLRQPAATMPNRVWYDSAVTQDLVRLGKNKNGN